MQFIELVLLSFFLSLLPFTELRLSIPLVISLGLNPFIAFISAIFGNLIVIPLVFLFLDSAHNSLIKFKPYEKLFNLTVKRIRKRKERVRLQINKYGLIALTLFVSIPLPVTGAYTGVLIGWLLNLPRKAAIIAISLGVVIAGILVTLTSMGFNFIF